LFVDRASSDRRSKENTHTDKKKQQEQSEKEMQNHFITITNENQNQPNGYDNKEETSLSSSTARSVQLAKQCHENDIAKLVLVHEPGIEALIGSLHASGSLFEKPVNVQKARDDHMQFRRAMENRGVKVLSVREVLAMHCEDNLRYRVALEELALEVLQYKLIKKHIYESHTGTQVSQSHATSGDGLTSIQNYLLSNDYKRECLTKMGTNDLIDIIMLGPTCGLSKSHSNTPLRLDNLQMKPLLNLTFTRDQQIVTNKGLVLMNMGSVQRLRETRVMNFCFNKLNVPILGKIEAPGTCEGGDFISAGADLCFIGTGLRTNQNAIDQLLQNDWFGTRRVAVCRDLFDCDQQRMHLDTVFNICSNDCVVMLDAMIGESSPIRRLVTEYTQIEDPESGRKQYIVTRRDVELSKYVQEEGYHIIPISQAQQSAYGINFLNLGDNFLICADESTARTILKDEHFNGDVQVIDFSGMISMFGCLHCCSQVLQRQPAPINSKHHKEKHSTKVESSNVLIKRQNVDSQLCQNVLLVSPSYYDPTSRTELQSLPLHEDPGKASRSGPLNPANVAAVEANISASMLGERKSHNQIKRCFEHSVEKVINADATADKSLNLSFSYLDGLLQVHHVNKFLFAQYVTDKNKYSVFAAHTLTGVNGKCIFFPVPLARKSETKAALLELAKELYKKENIYQFDNIITSEEERFHGGNVVFDRANGRVFLLQVAGRANNHSVKQSVTRCMNQLAITTHSFCIKDIQSENRINKSYLFENANSVVFVGSNFALLCCEMIESKEKAEELRQLLANGNKRTVIDITYEEQQSHAINGVVELADENGKPFLIMSQAGWLSLSEEKKQKLLELVEHVETVNLDTLEEINGGSLNDMLVTLF
jgi:arginine deiminase